MTDIHSFAPISHATASRLILGSMPGNASLDAAQYYAHPRNSFWRIMETILDLPAGASYENRCVALADSGIALWDVLASCVRSGSLDADIVPASVIPNDFCAFLRAHPGIGIIYFNGAMAEKLYLKHVLPGLPAELAAIPRQKLPSTSPANASISHEGKLAQWRVAGSVVYKVHLEKVP